MQRTSRAVRLVADSGAVVTVNPDHDGNAEPVALKVEVPDDHGTTVTALADLDGETADALADAIDEARGRRKRQRGNAAGS
jgi:pyrroline-5-carboxylate reductase